jgi:hypothetical protein
VPSNLLGSQHPFDSDRLTVGPLSFRFSNRFCQRGVSQVCQLTASAPTQGPQQMKGVIRADEFCNLDPLLLIPVIPFYTEIELIRETIEAVPED